MLNRGLDKQELLRVVDSVANEKSIDKELILSSMETAIQRAAYSKFGTENEIEAQIDRKSGNIKIQKVLIIVDKVEDPAREISIKDAKSISFFLKSCSVLEKPHLIFFSAVSFSVLFSEEIRSATDSACDRSSFPFLKARIVNSPGVAVLHPFSISSSVILF